MDQFNFVSANVRGLNTKEKRLKFYNWLSDSKVDIAFIQETHYVERNEFLYNSIWPGKSIHCYSDSPLSRGVSILIRKGLEIEILAIHRSNDGRKLLINVKIGDIDLTLVNIYAPNNETYRVQFFKRMRSFINNYSNNATNIAVCGDFNCKLNNSTDRSSKLLKEILAQLHVVDIWKDKLNDTDGFTWCDATDTPKSRIDFIFLSKYLYLKAKNISVRKIPGTHSNGTRMSDHKAIRFNVKLHENERGTGYWKLNTSLLEKSDYKEKIYDIIQNISKLSVTCMQKWEQLKQEVKRFSIHYSIKSQKSYKDQIKNIEKEIIEIESLPYLEINMNKKRTLERQLSDLYDRRAKGAQIRSRAKWINEGEKNTKFFLGLEKKHQTQNTIYELKNKNNDTLSTDDDILGEMCSFYEELYRSKNISSSDIENYLQNSNIMCLSENVKNTCDQFPNLEECRDSVMNMKHNKSPGLDGLPVEFYQCFWDKISILFHNMLKEIFSLDEMTFSQRLAVLSLIHKKGERSQLTNYRPISLTNTDYKIIAFIFARRLQKVIDNYIGNEQTAYIKGRYIGSNARLILDIFEYCENNNQNGILLFLDFEKAFDSVEWNFLFKTLKKFNFGPDFIKWIKILYKNPVFRLKNNGWISKTCAMNRGIRQGCPISAILYLFVAEILSSKIKENNLIHGFTSKNLQDEIKNVQHADDMTVTLGDIESMKHAIGTIDKFCKLAGSKINLSKTECILLGNLKDQFENLEGIKVAKQAVKCLGIFVGHDKIECYNKNWMKIYHDIEILFESWKKRKLTLFGKVTVVNSLALPKLIYVSSILELPGRNYVNDINRVIYNFIWNKTDRIK